MEKMISVRDEDKVNKIKTIMVVALIAAIIMWIIAFTNYMDEDNWKSVTIMPSLFQFYTSEHAIVEIYEMRLFYAGILELIIVLCSSISLVRGKRCSLIITRDIVECVDKFGKQSTIPIKQIVSVEVSDKLSSLVINTSSAVYSFTYIKNRYEIQKVVTEMLQNQ